MATVLLRRPRFLGERVPSRSQTVKEQIQSNLGSGYTVEETAQGFKASTTPVQYLKERDSRTKIKAQGKEYVYDTYVPKEYTLSKTGEVLAEIDRGVYNVDTYSWGSRNAVYVKSVTDYVNQTQETFGKREMKGDRDTIKKTSETIAGVQKQFGIIDQTSKEYELSRRTPEQNKLIRDKGFTTKYSMEYAVAGMDKDQRREYYKAVAKQRSAQFALEARAQRIARDKTGDYLAGLEGERREYAKNLFNLQQSYKVVPKNYVSSDIKSDITFFNPQSSETKTGMETPFFLPNQNNIFEGTQDFSVVKNADITNAIEKERAKGGIKGFFLSTYTVQASEKPADVYAMKASRARIEGKEVAAFAYGAQEFASGVFSGAGKTAKYAITNPVETGLVVATYPYSLVYVGAQFYAGKDEFGTQLTTRPIKTFGELTGQVGFGVVVGKSFGVVRNEIKTPSEQLPSNFDLNIKKQTEFQTTFNKVGERVIYNKNMLNFAKQKVGKGELQSTIYSSKKVVQHGKIVSTPDILKLREEIVGKPSNLGTTYGIPIKVEKTIQTTLSQPELIAVNKFFPSDVRPVWVKNNQLYFQGGMFGGPARKFTSRPDSASMFKVVDKSRLYSSDEFNLKTVYPFGGIKTMDRAQANFQNLKYAKSFDTVFGKVEIVKKFMPETQYKLWGDNVKIIRKSGTYPPPAIIESPKTSIQKNVLISPVKNTAQSIFDNQKYATVGDVIFGTTKTYSKTTLSTTKSVVEQKSLSPFVKSESVPVSKSANVGAFVSVGLLPKNKIIGDVNNKFDERLIMDNKQVSKLFTPSDVSQYEYAGVKNKVNVVSVELNKPADAVDYALKPRLKNELYSETRVETALKSDLKLDVTTNTIVETTTITRTPTGGVTTEPINDVPPPPKIIRSVFDSPKDKKSGLFSVQVRRKGIFKEITKTTNLQSALLSGQKNVLNTAAASFKVVSLSGEKVGFSNLPGNIFYSSKKEPGVFVQRREKRISSYGEKKEITYKGIMLNRSKNIFGRF